VRIVERLQLLHDKDGQASFQDNDVTLHAFMPGFESWGAGEPRLVLWIAEPMQDPNAIKDKIEAMEAAGEVSAADVHVVFVPKPGRAVKQALEYAEGIVTWLRPIVGQ